MAIFHALKNRIPLWVHIKSEITSLSLRRYFLENDNIAVGLNSYGCFDSRRIPKNTVIGRYCSFAPTASIFNGNHGLDFLSLHPYLYNTTLGLVKQETIQRTKCVIEDDVWIGHLATILPSVNTIGRGSVIAAGSVVTKDVPRYAIVGGNPARIIRFRFSKDIIAKIERTEWWLLSADELGQLITVNPLLVYSPASFL